jgi:CHAD domain-containing protein
MELDYVKLKDIKPALAGYIRKSQTLLKRSVVPDEKAVHDIRVLMKKSRAVLKLTLPQIDSPYNERNVADLLEVGKILGTLRETSVQRKTLKEYRKEFPDLFFGLHDNEKLNSLLEKPEIVTEPSNELKKVLSQIDTLLSNTSYRIRFQAMNTIDPQILIKELEITYLMVTDIYLRCRNNPKPDTIHKLRKKSKDFLYQLYIFRPLNPSVIKTLEKKLDNMTQNLGKYNDLTQIIRTLDYKYKEGKNPSSLDELIIKLRDAQDRYLTKVWPTAYQVFCPGQKLVNVLGFKLLVI